MNSINPHQYLENSDLLFSKAEVAETVKLLAEQITSECESDFPIVVSVMNGALIFAGQLVPHLAFPLELDYLHATRYQDGTDGKEITWIVKPSEDIAGRNILILDDILDEGMTLSAIVDECYSCGARQVKIAVLIEKELSINKPVQANYVGFKVPNRYVFGSGMDIHGLWRNLPAIYALKNT